MNVEFRSIGKSVAAAIALTLAALLVVSPAQAIPLLGNLANGVGGVFGGFPDAGDEFRTGNSALTVTGISVLWASGNQGANNRVSIYTDLDGLPSTTQVGAWFTSSALTTSNTIINYTSGSAALLANTTYHLVIDILDGSIPAFTINTAYFSDASTLGAANAPLNSSYGDIQAGAWNEDPTNLIWQINGIAGAKGIAAAATVPEPASLALLGIGLAGLGFSRRKKA